MNFEKLKAASAACNPTKTLPNKCVIEHVTTLLHRMKSEQQAIKDQLNQPRDYRYTTPGLGGYFEFVVAYIDPDIKRYDENSDVKRLFATDMFDYLLDEHTNRLIRSFKHRYIHITNSSMHHLVTIPDDYIDLDDNDLPYLKSITNESAVRIGYNIDSARYVDKTLYSDLITALKATTYNDIAATDMQWFTSKNGLRGEILCIHLYPAGRQQTINYLAGIELKEKFTKDRFLKKYRDAVLDEIAACDFNDTIEEALCTIFKAHDFSEYEYLWGKFQLHYGTAQPYTFEVKSHDLIMRSNCSNGCNTLVFTIGFATNKNKRADVNVVTLQSRDLITKEMSDTFWASDEIDSLLLRFDLPVSNRKIFYCTYDIDEFYEKLVEIIKANVEKTGLTVVKCYLDHDNDDDQQITIQFKNPVYKQFSQL